ncbi:MAG: class I SAM-dependent methyltransferase [Phycisphaeraceae bacterium]
MPQYEPFDWYEQPLYYDIVFDAGTDDEADFLDAVRDRYVTSRGRRVLEPACGSGRLVAAMAQRGYRVTGLDISDAMLSFARQRLKARGLKASLRRGDMSDFHMPARFDLAHCLVSSFKYLLTENSARRHLHCVAEALVPGGVYVLGVHLSEYDVDQRSRERWVAQRDGVQVVCNIQSWPPDATTRQESVRARIMATDPAGATHRCESHWQFRTYDAPQLARLLERAPALEHVATYGFDHRIDRPITFAGERLDHVLILRKRSG